MKFSQLALGQIFEFDGSTWVKMTPFIAKCTSSDRQKFMARYAQVTVTGQAMPTEAPITSHQIDAGTVNGAFDAFYRECTSLLEQSLAHHPAEIRDAARYRLEEARRHFHELLRNPT